MNNSCLKIEEVINKRLCTGCGTCYSACPNNCISIVENETEGIYQAKIDYSRCDNCGNCNDVCPQIDIIERKKGDEDVFFGKNISCFYGYSMDKTLRYNASSGGLITAISKFALNKCIVNGAIFVGPSANNPLRFEAKICKTEEEIISRNGSKYCPVSLNKILKDILKENNEDTYIYIGLPCHLKGLSNFISVFPELKKKIKYVFGIFCSHTPNFLGTDFILKKWHIPVFKIKKIEYRGNGWPGAMTIFTSKKINIPSTSYWGKYFSNNFFTPTHCLLCDDLFAVDSDISFGDAWLDRFRNDNFGISIGIIRTELGKEILEECKKKGKIFYENIDKKEVNNSQYDNVLFKNILLEDRKNRLLKFPKTLKIPIGFKYYNKFTIANANLSGRKIFRNFMLFLSGYPEKIYFKILGKIKSTLLKNKQFN